MLRSAFSDRYDLPSSLYFRRRGRRRRRRCLRHHHHHHHHHLFALWKYRNYTRKLQLCAFQRLTQVKRRQAGQDPLY